MLSIPLGPRYLQGIWIRLWRKIRSCIKILKKNPSMPKNEWKINNHRETRLITLGTINELLKIDNEHVISIIKKQPMS